MKIRRGYFLAVGACITVVFTLAVGVIAYNISIPAKLLFILCPVILYIIFGFILINFFEDSDTTDRHEHNLDEIGRQMQEIMRLNKTLIENEIKIMEREIRSYLPEK